MRRFKPHIKSDRTPTPSRERTATPKLDHPVTITIASEHLVCKDSAHPPERETLRLDLSCKNLPGSKYHLYKYYAVLNVNGESQKTISAERGTDPTWKGVLTL